MSDPRIEAAADGMDDSLTMLGVNAAERPDHGGETTGEALARIALTCADHWDAEHDIVRVRVDELIAAFVDAVDEEIHYTHAEELARDMVMRLKGEAK